MNLLPDIFNCKIGVVGLGYVGLPLALEFSRCNKCCLTQKTIKRKVVGFDINKMRISQLCEGIDLTKETSEEDLKKQDNIMFSSNIKDLLDLDVYLITVPTPITKEKLPDLSMVINASEMLGNILSKRNSSIKPIVIYESTVYPGATEEVCIPILENKSNLKINSGFFCGYSPERINPGDSSHKLVDIKKVTSGSDKISADWINDFYGSIIKAGTFKAQNIKVAEAAKIIENTQRDLNIALMNELSIIFNLMSIDTLEVLEAAGSKWNFLNFRPGLVGGHCIGVDPYYLKWKAEKLGHKPEILTAGRNVNERMHLFLVEKIKKILKNNFKSKKILILGYTFKENCPDIRNTKVFDLFSALKSLQIDISIYDPIADFEKAQNTVKESVIKSLEINEKFDILVIAVKHKYFLKMKNIQFNSFLKSNGKIIDIKGILEKSSNIVRI